MALEALYELQKKREVESDRELLSADRHGSLPDFITAAWPQLKPMEEYQDNWHIHAVCERLEAVTRGQIKRLQVWLPPGMAKTGVMSVFWPAWEWTTNPWVRYWTASYEIRLSGRISSMSRDLMLSDWYQERWGNIFSFIREGENYFGNDKGGTRLATAPRSTGSGEHGHRIIIDDPINAKEADALSKITLDEVNNWYDGTVSTRGIGSDFAKVIVMQRLSELDLAAHAMESDDWEILCLPERYEPNHPFVWPKDPRTVDGELLWPTYRTEEQSKALAKQLTTFRAAGQLQQRPSSREGDLLLQSWWRFFDPRIREKEDWGKLPRFTMIVTSVDTPQKDKETNDNISIQCWGVKGADRYLLDLRLAKLNYGSAKREVKEIAKWSRKTWPQAPNYVLIENAAYGVEMITDLKREITGIQKISRGADGDKIMRAEAASDALESGNCFVPGYGPPWQPSYDEHKTPADIAQLIHNCTVFPNGQHDDDVDAWSQAMNWLRSRSVTPMKTSFHGRRR